MARKNAHKVGIKILTDTQLENVLPTYENLFEKIEVCREVAEMVNRGRDEHYQYNFMYDNVFSILGARGTGKTSVAFTLREKIQNKAKENKKREGDIVLPLIIPEVIPDTCTVLGWILAIVREEIENLEEKIGDLEKGSCWDGCSRANLGNIESPLLNKLDNMNQLLHAGNYNPGNELSYYRAINNSVIQAGDYYKFAKEIAGLWDAWIERIKYYERKCGTNNSTPLIYFIFDDVDLAPEKIDEILSVIIKYLSHPNIIVITTADEKLFLEVIRNRLDKNIGRLPVEWRQYLAKKEEHYPSPWIVAKEEVQKENPPKKGEDIARRYLGKVLPASSRYYLSLYNSAKQKQEFSLESYENLGVGVKEKIQNLIDKVEDGKEKPNNFMVRNDEIGFFYLKFMGDTSRQIGNVFIALSELVNALIKISDGKSKKRDPIMQVYNNIVFFLRVAINSNHKLAQVIEDVDVFVDEVFQYNYNQWKLYVNYSKLNEYLAKEHEEREVIPIEIGIALYSLLAFVENVLLIMECALPNGLTERSKVHAVRFLAEFLQKRIPSIRFIFNDVLPADDFFFHYANLLDRLEDINIKDITDVKFNLEYFYDLKYFSYNQKIGKRELIKIYKMDPIWFKELIGRLFMVYGNVYLLNANDINDIKVGWGGGFLINYQNYINSMMLKNIVKIFEVPELQKEWDLLLKREQVSIFDFSEGEAVEEVCSNIKYQILGGETELIGNEFVSMEKVINAINKDSDDNMKFIRVLDGKKEQAVNNITEEHLQKTDIILQRIKIIYARLETMELVKATPGNDNNAIIKDPIRVLDMLDDMLYEETHPYEDEIKELSKKIRDKMSESVPDSLIVDIRTYNDIISIMSDILMWCQNHSMFYNDDGEELVRNAKKVMRSTDLAVNLSDDYELGQAVRIGMYLKEIIGLQSLYLYALVYERYLGGDSYSSRELENMKTRTGQRDTYYYKLFQYACDMLTDMNDNKLKDEEYEIALVIKKAYLQERRNYVKSIIQGEDNE